MRTKEELKQIFLKEAEDILDQHLTKLLEITNDITKDQTDKAKVHYNTILSVANSLKAKDSVTDEELEFIRENMNEWQADLLPLVVNRLTIN